MENSTDFDQIDSSDNAWKIVAILMDNAWKMVPIMIRSILRIMHGK